MNKQRLIMFSGMLIILNSCFDTTKEIENEFGTDKLISNPNKDNLLFVNEYNVDSLRKRVFLFGDTLAYNELRAWTWEVDMKKIIFESEVMASHFNYGPAHYQLYLCYLNELRKNRLKISDLDLEFQLWLNDILTTGVDKGCIECEQELEWLKSH